MKVSHGFEVGLAFEGGGVVSDRGGTDGVEGDGIILFIVGIEGVLPADGMLLLLVDGVCAHESPLIGRSPVCGWRCLLEPELELS